MLVSNTGDVNAPINTGSVLQAQYTADSKFVNLPTTISASGSISSAVILNNGFRVFSIGMTSTQAGDLKVQRYLDEEGTIPQDSDTPFDVALTANQAANMNVTDGKPFRSMIITVTNSSGVEATIDPFLLLFQAY